MKNTYKVNEEAVKKIAKRVYDNGSTVINRNDLEEMFPTIKESEDEKIRKELIDFFSGSHATDTFRGIPWDRVVAWLEKQGNLMGALQAANKEIGELVEENYYLKEKQSKQKPFEWSEEDEKYFNILISLANNPSAEGMFDYHKTNKSAFNNWLKSLKERCCPQKYWKPTEEQIGALERIIDSTVSSHTFILKELVKQLKAL